MFNLLATKDIYFDDDSLDEEEDLLKIAILYRLNYKRRKKAEIKRERMLKEKLSEKEKFSKQQTLDGKRNPGGMLNRLAVCDEDQQKKLDGEYFRIVKNLETDDDFYDYFHMTRDQFEAIHDIIENDIKKEDVHLRRCIESRERLALTIRFLASGKSRSALSQQYQISATTTYRIVFTVCSAILAKLAPTFMPTVTASTWLRISNEFQTLFNFPNCLGVLGGRVLHLKYTGLFLFLFVVDALSNFTLIDLSGYYPLNTEDFLSKSNFGQQLAKNDYKLPQDKPLMSGQPSVPYVFIGSEEFPMHRCVLKPFSDNQIARKPECKILNEKLNEMRLISDQAFNSLQSQWNVLQNYMNFKVDLLELILKTTCCLQNYINATSTSDTSRLMSPKSEAILKLDKCARIQEIEFTDIRKSFNEYFIANEQ